MRGIIAKVEARQGWSLRRLRRTYWSVQIGHNGEVVYTSETYPTTAKRDQTALQVAAQLEVPYSAASSMKLNIVDEEC